MSDEISNELIDFDFNSDTVEIGYPKIAAGTYPFKVHKTYKKENSARNGNNLVVEFANATQLTALQSDPTKPARALEPGTFVLTVYCPMQDSGKMKPGQWMERITEIHRACGLTGKPTTGDWFGKTVSAKVVMQPKRVVKNEATGEEKTYDESNAIDKVLPHVG